MRDSRYTSTVGGSLPTISNIDNSLSDDPSAQNSLLRSDLLQGLQPLSTNDFSLFRNDDEPMYDIAAFYREESRKHVAAQRPTGPLLDQPKAEDEEQDDNGFLPLLGADAALHMPPQSQAPVAQGTPQFGTAPSAAGTPSFPTATPQMLNMPIQHAMHRMNQQVPSIENVPLRWQVKTGVKQSSKQTKRLVTGAVIATSAVLVVLIGWYLSHANGSSAPNTAQSAPTASSIVPTPDGPRPTPTPVQFHPALSSTGSMVPGGSITLNGKNFPPGGKVTFTVDGKAMAYVVQPANALAAEMLKPGMSRAERLVTALDGPVTVQPDGTFVKTFPIPLDWQPGSKHTILASVQSSQSTAQVQLGLEMQPPGQPGITPTPTPVTCLGATSQQLSFAGVTGKSDPAAQTVVVTNCGVSGNWSTTITTDDGAAWLSTDTTSGMLSAGGSKTLTVTASNLKANLSAGTYSGHVTFTLGSSTLTVNILLTVANNPCIQASPTALTFHGIAGTTDPALQSVTITNCGDTSNWAAVTATDTGGSWLSTSSTGSTIQGGSTQTISVIVTSIKAGLAAGTYTGYVTFSIGPKAVTVNVALIIANAPCIQASTQSLAFNGVAGSNDPGSQSVTITNCGPGGNWSAAVSTNDGANWLSTGSTSGTLNAGSSQSVNIFASNTAAKLNPGTYTGHVAFTTGNSTASVTVTFIVAQAPCVKANTQALTFNTVVGQGNPTNQAITLSNCGGTGNWTASTGSGTGWLSVNPNSGTLNAGASKSISIGATLGSLAAGTYTGKIMFTSGSTTAIVNVTFIVTPAPCIQSNSQSLTFNGVAGTSDPASQSITITNCGGSGNWSASTTTTDGAHWLSAGTTSGTLSAGASQSISITASNQSASLNAGTYTGSITFTLGTSSTTVNVKLVVVAPACLQLQGGGQSTTLNYSATVRAGDPSSQAVTLVNCGASGSVSASISFNTGSGWITDDLTNGTTIAAGGSQTVNISTPITGLSAGTYTGSITYTITTSTGTSTVTVNISLVVNNLTG